MDEDAMEMEMQPMPHVPEQTDDVHKAEEEMAMDRRDGSNAGTGGDGQGGKTEEPRKKQLDASVHMTMKAFRRVRCRSEMGRVGAEVLRAGPVGRVAAVRGVLRGPVLGLGQADDGQSDRAGAQRNQAHERRRALCY